MHHFAAASDYTEMKKYDYKKILTSLIQSFTPLINKSVKATIPIVDAEIVIQLCKEIMSNLKNAPSLLELKSPIIVFGDIHGHVLDLIRLVHEFIMNPKFNDFKFLFLGDFVDRGEFSVETIIIIFLLIATEPDKIFCIRGNHEFDEIARVNGFYTQVLVTYSSETKLRVYNSFISAFDWMPLSAKIDSNILCLHGGISPLLASINQLKMLERPCSNFSDKLISDILWSDPRDVDDFERSDRGLGCYFGETHLKSFLEDNHLNLLVRAHECVYECKYTHDNMCLTVFGASNYCGLSGNKASVLIIHSANEREIGNFDPMRYLTREDVTFKKISYHFRSSSSTAFTKRLVLLPNKRLNKRNTKTILPMLI